MREKKEYIVITFNATTAALAMEKACNSAGIPGRIIPVPGEISAGCGLAWRIEPNEYLSNEDKIAKLGITYEGIFRVVI